MRGSHKRNHIVLLCGILCAAGCVQDDGATDEVLLFAAASTAGPMRALVQTWNEQYDSPVRASYASSSTLAQQIVQGAPADLFVSANPSWMDHLEEQGALMRESRTRLMRGQLVLIEPRTSPVAAFEGWESLPKRLGSGRLATGDGTHVPLGMYTQEALTHLGMWSVLAPQATNAHNARVALAQVERGEARLGIAYASDAKASERVRVVAFLPAESHSPIVYTVSMTSTANPLLAQDVLDHLTGPTAHATYAAHHFVGVP